MDNADGGRRGLRPRPGPELRRALAGHWNLEPAADGTDLGGSSSLNLLVASGGRRYVARVHRPAVIPERLETGMGLLARVHNLLRGVESGRAGRRPRFANHLEPADVLAVTRRATTRIRGWGPSAGASDLAAGADQLAGLVAEA
jgi:hypothetical protein